MATFAVVGGVVGALLGILVSRLDQRLALPVAGRGLAIGVLIGFWVGCGEEFLLPAWSRRVGFFALNVSRVLLYSAVLTGILTVVNGFGISIQFGVGFPEGVRRYVFEDQLVRDFLLSVFAVVVVASILEVRTLHNRGEIRLVLTGRYRYPRQETRVFLFADLVGSTTLAERLGSLDYSSFLRECFQDTSEAILAWRGDVYQYTGDGVIVTWRMNKRATGGVPLSCYFEMAAALAARTEDYQRRFGAVPRLRGAVHGGEVVTTWVGEAKRELAFHGDTLNAAARIEAMAKEIGAECLASDWALRHVNVPAELDVEPIGDVQLRGRQEPMSLFAVARRPVGRTEGSR